MKIALAVGAANPSLSASDRLFADALLERGAQPLILRWNVDAEERFLSCSAVVLRATWDYQDAPDAFARWIRSLEQGGCRVFNSAALAIWNNDKRRIIELAAKGANVPETIAISGGTDLSMTIAALGGDAVVKPAWGGDGLGVRRANVATIATVIESIEREAPGRPTMAQPYLPEIAEGEWSLVFLDGMFVHAVLKRPASGEFRVNSRFGGTRDVASPTRRMIEDAERIVSLLPEKPLYARIDGVVRDGRLLCTEVELTDPNLYFLDLPRCTMRTSGLSASTPR